MFSFDEREFIQIGVFFQLFNLRAYVSVCDRTAIGHDGEAVTPGEIRRIGAI